MEDDFLLIWVHTHTRGILILKPLGPPSPTLVKKRPINPVEPEATRSVGESRKDKDKDRQRQEKRLALSISDPQSKSHTINTRVSVLLIDDGNTLQKKLCSFGPTHTKTPNQSHSHDIFFSKIDILFDTSSPIHPFPRN